MTARDEASEMLDTIQRRLDAVAKDSNLYDLICTSIDIARRDQWSRGRVREFVRGIEQILNGNAAKGEVK